MIIIRRTRVDDRETAGQTDVEAGMHSITNLITGISIIHHCHDAEITKEASLVIVDFGFVF